MGIFTPLEVRNRDQLQLMQADVSTLPAVFEAMGQMREQIEQLDLVCRALTELIVAKGVATQSELSVVLQQIDLEDGVEDGRARSKVRRNAPRCARCDRFINPKRDRCVYCGESMAIAGGEPYRDKRASVRATAMAECARCGKTVPETSTFFTGGGLACSDCYDPSTD